MARGTVSNTLLTGATRREGGNGSNRISIGGSFPYSLLSTNRISGDLPTSMPGDLPSMFTLHQPPASPRKNRRLDSASEDQNEAPRH